MDVIAYNRGAWDREVEKGNPWTVPVGPEVIAAARRGEWSVLLTPTRPVPRDWFPEMRGADVLCLASGGGQQGPIFAAAGARVTVLDNSPQQLARDRLVADREGLEIATVLGQMADLSAFPDESFDLVFHPVSNAFAPAVRPVWCEAWRVLRGGGVLLAGFMNPAIYLFDLELADEQGVLEVRYTLPYSDLKDAPEELRRRYIEQGEPLEFSHSLEDQIGGQADAGFLITGLYEDGRPPKSNDVLSRYMPVCIATRAAKRGT
jgi:SAM-dependent methyltransferase